MTYRHVAVAAVILASISIALAEAPSAASKPAGNSAAASQPATAAPAATNINFAATRPAPAPAASQPAAPATHPFDPAEASADDVIRRLMNERKVPILADAATSAPASAPATEAPQAIIKPLPMPPGATVFNRLGRFIKESGSIWWTFRYESEKGVLYEPPMRVLPNQELDSIENILENSPADSVRFIISGEITQYHGQQYLLVRKMLVKRTAEGL